METNEKTKQDGAQISTEFIENINFKKNNIMSTQKLLELIQNLKKQKENFMELGK